MQQPSPQVSINLTASRALVLAGAAIGLLLLAIGWLVTFLTSNRDLGFWITVIGAFIMSLASFWGGLFLDKEHPAIRTVLLAIGAFVAVSAFLGLATSLRSLQALFG